MAWIVGAVITMLGFLFTGCATLADCKSACGDRFTFEESPFQRSRCTCADPEPERPDYGREKVRDASGPCQPKKIRTSGLAVNP